MNILIFFLGVIVGSFLNVCIYRIPEGISIITPGSFCPICKHHLSWRDNIPLLSFILLKGRCRYCGGRISLQYPLVELITGVIFLLFYLKFDLSFNFFIFISVSSLLLIAMFIDLRFMLLPDIVMYPSIIIGVFYTIVTRLPYNLLTAVGFAVGFYLLGVIFKGGLGLGDVELIAIISLLLGFYGTLSVVIISSLTGTMYGLYLIKKGRAGLKSRVPFGPFLITSFLLVSIFNIPVFCQLH